ncbi:MAG: SUMF1/EgtB/PvdO family nonheme iron enzyme [Blastocatellia bacterium]|nr:SUMF1/EgtB/PvdO family nonheme iron enzyme [Blastocatellia bacterium]
MLTSETMLEKRYRIVRKVASGGMGHIYEAIDTRLGNVPVAVKQLKPELASEPSLLTAFEREATVLARLKHPALPHVKDYFPGTNGYFLVMEWITGPTLSERQQHGGAVPLATVQAWGTQLLQVVAFLHSQPPPIIHRDIKPANIKVNDQGTLFLLDFGIAKELRNTVNTLVFTPDGATPYTAFELIGDHAGEVDTCCDVYSAGAVLYRMLTNQPPVKPLERVTARALGKADPLRPVEELNPKVSPELASVIWKMLAVFPHDRYARIEAALQGWQEAFETTVVRPTPLANSSLAPPAPVKTPNRIEISVAKPVPPPVVIAPPPARIIQPPPKPVEPRVFKNSLGMEFVLIPIGPFQMGSSEKDVQRAFQTARSVNERVLELWFRAETPRHEVLISRAYYLGKYLVTQREWQAVMGTNPSFFKDDDLPVEQVSWNDCQEFIAKLNARQDGSQYRLPSEAEWEYACRAGTTGDYAGELEKLGWYWENSGIKTHPVGKKDPNNWGLYDMHGNVSEWCQDWYDQSYYRSSPGMDPLGPQAGTYRVIRGGGWRTRAVYCRSALRLWHPPVNRYHALGFRLVRTAL